MASQAIANINVRYGADVSEFSKAQKLVNRDLYDNKKVATALDKQFKATFDPKNVELLDRELAHLEESLTANELKAALLEEELAKMNKDAEDFNMAAYVKLETQLAACYQEDVKLNKQISKTQKNINAINTDNLEDMSYDFKQAAKQAGYLNEEISQTDNFVNDISAAMESVTGGEGLGGAIEGVTSLDTSMSGLLTTVLKLPGPLKVAGAAVAVFAGAALGAEKNTNMLNQIMMEVGPTAEAMGVDLDSATKATNDLYVATGDMEGSITAINATMTAYGDTIKTTTGLTAAAANMYMIQANGILDVTEAATIASDAQDTFGASTLEANAAVMKSQELIAQYPQQADDIADSIREFGDTIVAVGYDVNEFFTLLDVGLALGAKNTDELVNSVNEMFLAITEGSPEAVAALDSIGLSASTIQEMIESGQGPEALMEILTALNDTTDATLQLTAAQVLFGTFGEEFVVPMLNNQNGAFEQLLVTYELNNQATKQLAEVTKGDLAPAIMSIGLTLGLSTQQCENLIFAFESGAISAMTFGQKLIILAAGVMVNGEAMGLSADQTQKMADKLTILTDDTATYQEKLAVLNGEFIKFFFGGVLNEEQMDKLTKSIDAQKKEVEKLAAEFNELGGVQGMLTDSTYEQFVANTELAESISKADWETMNYTDKVWALQDANVISREEASKLTGALNDLTSEYSTTETKVNAMKEAMVILTENGYVPNLEQISKFAPLLSEMAAGLDGSTISSNELTGEFAGMGKSLDTTSGELKDYTKKLEESLSPMEKAKKKARDLEDAFYGVDSSASDAASSVQDLNDALTTNATLPPPQEAPDSRGRGRSVGRTLPPQPTIQGFKATTTTTNSTTNNTTEFAPTIVVNGTSLSPSEMEKALTSAFDKMWKQKGRLL